MMKLVILLFFVFGFAFGDMKFSDPQPSFEKPRKMVVQISTDKEEDIHHILGSINNIIKEYSTGTIEVAVVAYYNGIRVLRKDEVPAIKDRITSLQAYDVTFIACENTMTSKKLSKDDLIDNISYAKAGLAEVMERVVDGWVNIRP